MEQQLPKTYAEILEILANINYNKPSWQVRLLTKGDGFLLQWVFMEKDLCDPEATEEMLQKCRKWYISPYMTVSEIIRTAYLAVQQAEMHEIAERFTFLGKRIFDPHLDYVELANKIDTIDLDVRIPK